MEHSYRLATVNRPGGERQAYGDGDYKALQRANAQNGHVS